MPQEGFKRMFTAILSVDVNGDRRLMGDDEDETVRTLASCREVLPTHTQQHNFKFMDSPGSNMLTEFVSVADGGWQYFMRLPTLSPAPKEMMAFLIFTALYALETTKRPNDIYG